MQMRSINWWFLILKIVLNFKFTGNCKIDENTIFKEFPPVNCMFLLKTLQFLKNFKSKTFFIYKNNQLSLNIEMILSVSFRIKKESKKLILAK